MKVWVCTKGEYEDEEVAAVYTDAATARRISEALDWSNPKEVELDPPLPAEVAAGLSHWAVSLVKDTGDPPRSQKPHIVSLDDLSWLKDGDEFNHNDYGAILFFRVWAVDQEHAIKAARDKRIQKLAGQ